eukprot:TRINITY_DN1744_c1_g1_i2.p1 TRINITY_DN1744_c1_g1~~TRINITY_DN1744_c1_g1_i2.p1  ORF type:complete len:173 (-),score=14.85 TRINITY_DN1744_c1_g1_i2:46-564(-)
MLSRCGKYIKYTKSKQSSFRCVSTLHNSHKQEYSGGIIEVGSFSSFTKMITEHEILLFAEASGDHNPLHLDEAYAKTTRFKTRIAHGFLTGSLISTVAASKLPGPGSIYISQTMNFKKPVYINDQITAYVEAVSINNRKRTVSFKTDCLNQHGEVVLEGSAEVLVRKDQLKL